MKEGFTALRDHMKDYANGIVSGDVLVKYIDDFVSSDAVYNMPDGLCNRILSLQDNLAFYVSNPLKRAEHTSYFGEENLKDLIFKFLSDTEN